MATARWPWRGRGEGPVALPTFFHLRMGEEDSMVGDGGTPGKGGIGVPPALKPDQGAWGVSLDGGRVPGLPDGVAVRGGSGRFVPTHSIFPTSFGSFTKCLPRKWRLRKGSESGKGGRDEMAGGQARAEGEDGLERRQIWRRGGRKKTRTKQQQLFSAAGGRNEQ